MKLNLDLEDLRRRESERIEWKKNVADIDDVISSIVAFSNDFSNLGGGYVICGAEELEDPTGFQKVEFIGLSPSRFKEIEGKVLNDCQNKVDPPIVPLTDEIEIPDSERRVLIFIAPATEHAHNYRKSGKDASTYYVRIGRSTREAIGTLLKDLLVKKKVLEPWDRRPNKTASISDVDLLLMREYLQTMSLWDPEIGVEKYLSANDSISAFIPPLMASNDLAVTLHPRNYTLLLFGAQPAKFFPGAYTILSVYPGEDRSSPFSERTEIVGSIVEQAKQIISRMNTESNTAFDKSSPHPNQLKYPRRALQEAVVNAIVHRDYESEQPTRITIFSDRIEINSPGTLPRAVDKDAFLLGKAAPYWKNQTLAFFFNKLQLAQAEGQGIPTILKTMREEGCPEPRFEVGEENLVCILPAHPRHKLFAQMREIENFIVIGNHQDALIKIEPIIKEDPNNFRILELYCEVVNIMHKHELVYNLLRSTRININSLPPKTLILLSETLLLCKEKEAQELANKFLNKAASGKLEEEEIKHLAIGIRKLGNNEEAIKFLDTSMERIPALSNNSSLLEIKAKAKIDLAKKCIDTAKQRDSSQRIKYLAWEQCRLYLDDAEKDLNEAMHTSTSSVEREFIENDLQFLGKLKNIAKRPNKSKKSTYYKQAKPKSKIKKS